jgi:hypothetical protein
MIACRIDRAIAAKLGFDFGWTVKVACYTDIAPAFERKVIEEMADGSRKVIDLQREGQGAA